MTASATGIRTVQSAIVAVEAADDEFFGSEAAHPLPLLAHLTRLDA